MARMRVVLDEVVCYHTEDITGADEFYLTGAVSDGEQSAGVLTKPISINTNQTKQFGPGGGTVFDAEVPDGRVLKVALAAFDEDANKDWSKYGETVKKIGERVSAELAKIPHKYAVAASTILPYAICNAERGESTACEQLAA